MHWCYHQLSCYMVSTLIAKDSWEYTLRQMNIYMKWNWIGGNYHDFAYLLCTVSTTTHNSSSNNKDNRRERERGITLVSVHVNWHFIYTYYQKSRLLQWNLPKTKQTSFIKKLSMTTHIVSHSFLKTNQQSFSVPSK